MPSGLQVIEHLCPSLSRYALALEAAGDPTEELWNGLIGSAYEEATYQYRLETVLKRAITKFTVYED